MDECRILLALMIASKADEKWMNADGLYKFLDRVLPRRWMLVCGSADKHPKMIEEYCRQMRHLEVKVVIIGAGLNPILGRVVAANFGIATETTIMCVPETEAAVTSVVWAPEFVALTCPGWGKNGMFNACVEACKRLAVYDEEILDRLAVCREEALENKQPQFDVRGALQKPETAAAAAPIQENRR